MRLDKEQKRLIRVWIRRTIRANNARSLFTQTDCQFGHSGCELGHVCPIEGKTLQACSVPECFTLNYVESALPQLVEAVHLGGLDSLHAEKGWATTVRRLMRHCDRFGHLMHVKIRNLWRFG